MNRIIYRDFLNDTRIYISARRFWHYLFADEIKKPNRKQYLGERFANGRLFYDGNPIFNLMNTETRNAIRIIQQDPYEYENHFTEWRGVCMVNYDNTANFNEICELVISLTMSRENYKNATKTCKEWLNAKENQIIGNTNG